MLYSCMMNMVSTWLYSGFGQAAHPTGQSPALSSGPLAPSLQGPLLTSHKPLLTCSLCFCLLGGPPLASRTPSTCCSSGTFLPLLFVTLPLGSPCSSSLPVVHRTHQPTHQPSPAGGRAWLVLGSPHNI